ncbi:MAG: diguanylate cyclase [Alphaproteobacteria bacterium]|nr:diguanylate cyclase [Alphaproteobacteria bacterium]
MSDMDICLDLETPPNEKDQKERDLAILQDADRLGIDLDALENFHNNEKKVEYTEKNNTTQNDEYKFWYDLDVGLKDVVDLLMNDSAHPIIMVSDDKPVYFNYVASQMLEISDVKSACGDPFLSFVAKEDWGVLTSNIGEMLTGGKKQKIKLKSAKGKLIYVDFHAIYLPDSKRFTFILVGDHQEKSNKPFFNNLYDDLTGLPNFFLFEDRVQMAVNNENYKDARLPKDLIAVVGVNIDNIELFRRLRLEDFVLKKIANTLVLSLKKNYTVARGLKYPFWILMPDIANPHDLDLELKKIMSILKEGVSDNFTTHDLVVSVGVSVFPNPARSAKKLIEQSISAIKEAQDQENTSLIMFHK